MSQNLTQEKLAEKCDISYTYLGDIERGRRSCTTITLNKIVIALKHDLSEFFSYLEPDSEIDEEKYLKLIKKIPKGKEELLIGILELLSK
ncbi:MAG: helix-turn-helix transcriptional regulator [bacterium]|nr:helix-turn-helix transcriptional regulator [bacterium]